MPSLQVRDLPEDLYLKLSESASREHRSLAQQSVVLLEKSLGTGSANQQRRQAVIAHLKATGKPIKYPKGMTPEALIREDRDR